MCYWFFLIPVFHLMYPMLLVSLDCPFMNASLVFSNVYIETGVTGVNECNL